VPPRLIAVAGPLSGTSLPLTQTETSIGRDNANHIGLADGSVSPRHCLLVFRDGRLMIRDLDRGNRSFVNGLPAEDRALEEGDEIQVGSSLFVLRLSDPQDDVTVRLKSDTTHHGNAADSVRVAEDAAPASAAIVMSREDVFGDFPVHAVETTTRVSRDLTALIRASAAINSVRGLVALERPLIDLIADAVPATRGALVAAGDGPRGMGSAIGWHRGTTGVATGAPMQVSRPLVERVLRDLVGILWYEFKDERTASDASASHATRSVLAAPLVAFDKVLGAIVLEVDGPDGAFDEGHLRLLMAIAGIAATAFEHAREVESLEDVNRRLQAALNLEHNMVGDSEGLRDIFRRIARVAPTDSTVLLTGESGTGKELVARSIHRNSPRAGRPFVAINCAAITETLLESELFGHEKGAFTGAITQKKGRLEVAEGGTVLLDEIGELSLALQAKLLRVLQEKAFERVGGTRLVHVDFRLVASTNRDLKAAIESGAFRRDLYYRLNVVSLSMPALRDRREDIPLLATAFLRRESEQAKRRVVGFSDEALACLMAYDWPGNVRELENAIEHAVVLGHDSLVRPDDLPEAVAESASSSTAPAAGAGTLRYHDAVRQTKIEVIERALSQAGGHPNAAARLLGLHPNYLHRLIRNLQVKNARTEGDR
jgi:transcriptional regulator with GAF, ATPase, and Fis domain